jgi:ubiquinone/menaquinone biosynthesis C-methylase UbiE
VTPVQLHLGCGKRFIPGFVHVDVADLPHVDHQCGIDRLPMFEDGSVDLVYCSHAFNYFDRIDGRRALGEWHRVLKPGGLLRLAVPDFEALSALYQRTGELSTVLGPLFGRIEVPTRDGHRVLFMRTTYDYSSLEAMCRAAGFRDFRRYDWRETIHRDHDDYSQAYVPHMDKEHGLLISLNVEAQK